MFGGLPRLFDRSFFIGFFLPASLLFSGVVGNLFAFGYVDSRVKDFLAEKSTFGAAVSIVIIWLLSIALMAANRPTIRLLEGYGQSNPFQLLLPRQKTEFTTKIEPIFKKLKRIIDARLGGVTPSDTINQDVVWRAVNAYPEEVRLVMPTKLGNVMRAYERYSDVVYGIEAIVVWSRLFMIIPEDARNRVREGESLFQFALNILITGAVTFVMYLALIAVSVGHNGTHSLLASLSFPIVFIPLVSAFLAWAGWSLLPGAAQQRGEQVKAIFDLYRSTLAEALGLKLPPSEEEERKMWRLVSRRMMLRLADDKLAGYDKSLNDFRKHNRKSASEESLCPAHSAASKEEDQKAEAS